MVFKLHKMFLKNLTHLPQTHIQLVLIQTVMTLIWLTVVHGDFLWLQKYHSDLFYGYEQFYTLNVKFNSYTQMFLLHAWPTGLQPNWHGH